MLKKLIRKLGKPEAGSGQSLVEMAIIAPLLIFMLIGVFEVGWALRGYLVLVNVNREITRFAVRPGYMDFSTHTTINESFLKVRNWVDTALGNQLNLNFANNGNATLIISHVVVNTGLPCEDTVGDCDCSQVSNNNYSKLFTLDDFFIHPQMPGQSHQTKTYPDPATAVNPKTTRMNFETLITTTLKPQNNELNCEVIKKGGIAGDNNFIVTELFYEQPQLFGFPLISNPLTDPVPLYSHTIMRLVGASRGNLTQNINTIGPVCFAYPFIVKKSVIDGKVPNDTIDILDGNEGGDWGWLTWNPHEDDRIYLGNELQFPQLSMTDYTNPVVPDDHSLNVGDWVASLEGTNEAVNESGKEYVNALIGQEIIIPVWDQFQRVNNPMPPPNQVDVYHISKFIRVRINANGADDIPSSKAVWATYLGDETENCQ